MPILPIVQKRLLPFASQLARQEPFNATHPLATFIPLEKVDVALPVIASAVVEAQPETIKLLVVAVPRTAKLVVVAAVPVARRKVRF